MQDRWNKSSGEFTGGNDLAEAAHWRRVLLQALLYELYQPEPTHEGPLSLAKLDRVFTNQSIADQLDKRVFATALPWTELSQHRPLAFGRQTRPTRPPMSKPIQEEILRDARWPMWVAAEFHSLQEMTPEEQNPIVCLRQLKTAIRVSAARLAEERASTYSSSAPTSHLGITMAALRRLERRGLPDLPVLCSRYPLLRSILTPDLLQHAPHLCLSRLRDHAVALAREEVHASLQRLHEDLPHLDDEARTRRRSQVLLQIKRWPRGGPRPWRPLWTPRVNSAPTAQAWHRHCDTIGKTPLQPDVWTVPAGWRGSELMLRTGRACMPRFSRCWSMARPGGSAALMLVVQYRWLVPPPRVRMAFRTRPGGFSAHLQLTCCMVP